MAIQIPNPGTGNGATGDNEFVLWSKVKDNFTDQTNAASRLVGNSNGNLAEMVDKGGVAGTGWGATSLTPLTNAETLPVDLKSGVYVFNDAATLRPPKMGQYDNLAIVARRHTTSTGAAIWLPYGTGSTGTITVEAFSATTRTFFNIYTDKNTTKEPTTGYLKAASPILHLFNDDLVKEHEAVEQDITVDKLGTGDYLIKGSTGLSDEGWNLSPPKDIHGNVLCFVEATEADGNINVKTYKRKFDFDIVAIVADYDQPFDIPEGHSVDLRLNDLTTEV